MKFWKLNYICQWRMALILPYVLFEKLLIDTRLLYGSDGSDISPVYKSLGLVDQM